MPIATVVFPAPPELYEVVAEILVFVDDMDRMKGKLKESGLL